MGSVICTVDATEIVDRWDSFSSVTNAKEIYMNTVESIRRGRYVCSLCCCDATGPLLITDGPFSPILYACSAIQHSAA